MKIGFFGPIGGLLLAALILTASTYFTPTDSPWRWVGFLGAVLAFLFGIYAGYGGKDGNPPSAPTAA